MCCTLSGSNEALHGSNTQAEGAGMLFCHSQITLRFSAKRRWLINRRQNVLLADMRNVLAADHQATGVQLPRGKKLEEER